jgi:bacterioferritin-associated ferredoxin
VQHGDAVPVDAPERQESVLIVCHCRRVTDREVVAAMARGASSLSDLARECGAGTDCRGCRSTLEDLLAPERRSFHVPTAEDRRRLHVVAA